jgi:hypothetical protein
VRRLEPEARIERRVADDDGRGVATAAAGVQPGADQRAADAGTLMVRPH